MKRLFAFVVATAFSFALMAQTPTQDTIRPNAQKTCADWKAAGQCPVAQNCRFWRADGLCPRDTEGVSCRQLIDEGRCPIRFTCAQFKELGRCPLHNARQQTAREGVEVRKQCAKAQGATSCCGRHGGHGNTEGISQNAENTTEEAQRRRARRANRTR